MSRNPSVAVRRRLSRKRFPGTAGAIVRMTAALLVLAGVLALAGAGRAEASSITNGTVTLSTIGAVTADTPYSSGQTIQLAVAANATLDETNLAAAGFPSGAVSMKFLECSDPGGLVANLPTKPGECEPETIGSISGAQSDGSLSTTYQLLALPDANLGTSNGTKCDTAADACVVGIFSNQNDFSKPHLFSSPFYIAANGDDGGENPGDGSPLAVTGPSADKSTVVASPLTVTADGASRSKITVVVNDTNGNPITTGQQVTLTAGSGHSVISVGSTVTATATTDATGTAVFTVADTTAEQVTYTATDTSGGSLPLSARPTVSFVAPVVTPANSSVTASPATVAQANGSDASMVTVTLEDQADPGVPVAGKSVTLAQGSGHSVITPLSATTDAQGVATFSVTDTTPETVTYTAQDTTDTISLTGLSASVTFGTLVASASKSTVVAAGPIASVAAQGADQSDAITVTLLASDGVSAVSGKTVTLTPQSGSAVVVPTSAVTNSQGQATFTVSDGTVESVRFSATDTTDSLPLTATASVDFEQPAASASVSAATASTPTVEADGTTSVTISVTVRDQFGNPLAGRVVQVTGSPSATVRIAPLTESSGVVGGTTDATGLAEFVANDTTAEKVSFTSVDTTDRVTLTTKVSTTFVATAPQATNATVTAGPTSVPANGTSASTVSVTLRDHNSNVIPGKSVALTALNGSSRITPAVATTNASGTATFRVTDSTSEVVTFLATDTTDQLPLVGETVSVTFGSPRPVPPTPADSALSVNRVSVPADGTSTAAVTVVLADVNGLPLSGRSVRLSALSGTSTVAPSTVVTDANGTAVFDVSDRTPESVTYTATDSSDGVALTGLSVTVTFTATSGSTSAPAPPPAMGIAETPDGGGYWQVAANGGVFAYGDAEFYGSAGSLALSRPVVGMAPTPDGRGYWLVASDGGIFSYGDAAFYGSTGNLTLNRPVVGMASTPDGRGYWLVASDGGIFAYGDAAFYGSTGNLTLNRPVVGMASTPDGRGYWLVASDGGIFAYGDAAFYGSTGNLTLNRPVVGMASTPDGRGYWLVASDGGIFAYGDARFYGSTGNLVLDQPVVGMASTSSGRGYWLVAADGGIFAYGDAAYHGSSAG